MVTATRTTEEIPPEAVGADGAREQAAEIAVDEIDGAPANLGLPLRRGGRIIHGRGIEHAAEIGDRVVATVRRRSDATSRPRCRMAHRCRSRLIRDGSIPVTVRAPGSRAAAI